VGAERPESEREKSGESFIFVRRGHEFTVIKAGKQAVSVKMVVRA
jgi:hypothetical protein